MKFEFDNNQPIYIQIAAALENEIVSGHLLSGAKLPSVRELAAQSKTNPNTVQKALQELERKKLIFTERTNGKFVTHEASEIAQAKEAIARSKIRRFAAEMKAMNVEEEVLKQWLEEELRK